MYKGTARTKSHIRDLVLSIRLKLCHWECYKRWHPDSDEEKALLLTTGEFLGESWVYLYFTHEHGARNPRLPLTGLRPPYDTGCRLLEITNVSLISYGCIAGR